MTLRGFDKPHGAAARPRTPSRTPTVCSCWRPTRATCGPSPLRRLQPLAGERGSTTTSAGSAMATSSR
eukprot:5344773-Lingulodinium_polyedra.AAC.1